VFLGTGTPLPDPDRSGPATAIVVDGAAYLFDAGAGVVRRASLGARKGIAALNSVNLKTAFLTHLHSDHTMGLPDLMFTPWTMGRTEPLELYGPVGTRAMTDGIQKAWALDIDRRLHDLQPATPRGWQVNVHEIQGGLVYRDERVTVTAIPVLHGAWERLPIASRPTTRPSSYRRRPAGRAFGCGLPKVRPADLRGLHDALDREGYPPWREYRRAYHTSTKELGEIATASRPGLLILYHRANPGCDQVGTNCGASGSEAEALAEMHQFYAGRVVEAHDLDVF